MSPGGYVVASMNYFPARVAQLRVKVNKEDRNLIIPAKKSPTDIFNGNISVQRDFGMGEFIPRD